MKRIITLALCAGSVLSGTALAGPADYQRAMRYNAAWLIGATNATPDNTFRMQLEYEFR